MGLINKIKQWFSSLKKEKKIYKVSYYKEDGTKCGDYLVETYDENVVVDIAMRRILNSDDCYDFTIEKLN